MKTRAILFSAPMVKALLEGCKTQTRRVVNARYLPIVEECLRVNGKWVFDTLDYELTTPYGRPGDLLWVRETFVQGYEYGDDDMPIYDGDERRVKTWYRATTPDLRWNHDYEKDHDSPPWKPSIHMPRVASRLTLEITGVRVERLQDICAADAAAEGVFTPEIGYANLGERAPIIQYGRLWEEINGAGAWDKNPFVWVIEFKVHRKNVDAFLLERQAA
jgi:hypothetical protein